MSRPIFTCLALLVPLAFARLASAQGAPAAVEGSQEPPTGPSSIPSLPPPSRAMSLHDALTYARAHQPAVLAGVARLEAQKAAASVPGAQWKPLIGVNAQLLGGTANNTTASYVSPELV